jgi:hypothetical protein
MPGQRGLSRRSGAAGASSVAGASAVPPPTCYWPALPTALMAFTPSACAEATKL